MKLPIINIVILVIGTLQTINTLLIVADMSSSHTGILTVIISAMTFNITIEIIIIIIPTQADQMLVGSAAVSHTMQDTLPLMSSRQFI